MRDRTILKLVACGLAASIWGSGTAARAANGETVGLTDVGGGKIEYVTSGRRGGEPVVFLHGGWMAFMFAPMAAEPALAQYRLIRIHRRGSAGSSDLTGPTTLEQGAADVAAPALVVWGSTSPPQMHLAAELLPDVQRKEVEGAGHMMLTQMPKAAAEIVAAFIRRHPIEPGH